MGEINPDADWEKDWRSEWRHQQGYKDACSPQDKERKGLEQKLCHFCQRLKADVEMRQLMVIDGDQEFLGVTCSNCYRKHPKYWWVDQDTKIRLPAAIVVPGMKTPVPKEKPKQQKKSKNAKRGRKCKKPTVNPSWWI